MKKTKINKDMLDTLKNLNNKIIIYIELENGCISSKSEELLNIANDLANENNMKVISVLIYSQLYKQINISSDYCLYINNNIQDFDNRTRAEVLSKVISYVKPEIVLFSNSFNSKIIAPYVASMLNLGLTSGCIKLIVNKNTGRLEQTRPAFDHNILATIVTPNQDVQICTVNTKMFSQKIHSIQKTFSVPNFFYCKIPIKENRLLNFEKSIETKMENDIENYKIIFCIGAGVKSVDYIKKVKFIAKFYNAAVGATRKIVENGWMKNEYQIGYSGKQVSPDIYITLGVSGSINHMLGLNNAKKIIAINNNSNAEIFKFSNIDIIVDVNEFIDSLYNYCKSQEN